MYQAVLPTQGNSTSCPAPLAAPALAAHVLCTCSLHTCRCPTALTSAVDRVAALCVWKEGSAAGFPGAVLTVRPPPPDSAWLGHVAPADPALDDPLFYTDPPATDTSILRTPQLPAALPGRPYTPGSPVHSHSGDLAPGHQHHAVDLALSRHRPRGYRCLADAVSHPTT